MSQRDIAWLDAKRQIRLASPNGTVTALTSPDVLWGAGWGAPTEDTLHAWPTFSPDGTQLACFRIRTDQASVVVLDRSGTQESELVDIGNRVPIYLCWSPNGARLAWLAQASEHLQLHVSRASNSGFDLPVAAGGPLFFSWIDHNRMAVFHGTEDGAGSLEIVYLDQRSTRTLPGSASNFCTPVLAGERLVYVTSNDGDDVQIVDAKLDGSDFRTLHPSHGLVALLPSPDGRRVAVASAVQPNTSPYTGLALIDLDSGSSEPLTDLECLAFQWRPDGQGLITASVDTDRNLLTWHHIDLDGRATHLVDLHPTRELGFYLRFFEQYAPTHPIVDDDAVLVAGGLADQPDPHGPPRIWRVALDGSSIEELAEGRFAVVGPAPKRRT